MNNSSMAYLSEFEPDFQENRWKFLKILFIFVTHFNKPCIRIKISFDSLENRIRISWNMSYSNSPKKSQNCVNLVIFGHVSLWRQLPEVARSLVFVAKSGCFGYSCLKVVDLDTVCTVSHLCVCVWSASINRRSSY